MNEQDDARTSGELVKFLILVVILLGTIGVVALLRPFIFGTIVPAVMGEGIVLPVTPQPIEPTAVPQSSQPADDDDEAAETAPDAEASDTPADDDEASAPSSDAMSEAADTETAVEEAETTSTETVHVVKQGETLALIANQYGVPIRSIIQRNGLANPDYIKIGTELIIPSPPANP